jgi:hypothetical protein
MKKLILVVFLLSFPASLRAQQAETGLNGFKFLAPLQIEIGRDNNFLVDRTSANEKLFVLSLPPSIQSGAPDIRPQKLDDTVLVMGIPKMAFVNDSKRHEFLVTWHPEFEVLTGNSDQNSFNQEALASFNYYVTRNVQVWFGDKFQTSKDPARTLNNVFVLLPRGDYRENSFVGSVEFQPTRLTNISFQYDTAYTKFGQPDPFQTQFSNSWSSGYSVGAARLLGRSQRIGVRYSLYTVRRINHAEKFDDVVDTHTPFEDPINSLTVQYRVRPNPSTVLGFSGGGLKSSAGMDYTFSGTLHRRFGNFWAGGTYARGLALQARTQNGFLQGPDNSGFYDLILFRLRGQTSQNTAILAETTISRATTSGLVDSRKALLGRMRFDYRVSDRKVLYASWESFNQSHNVYVQSPLSRNRFMMGIEISLASDSDRRSSHLNEDERYVALTDHGIRRRSLEDDN